MYVCFLSTFHLSNRTPKITRILTSKRANFDEVQFLKHTSKLIIFGTNNLQTIKHNTLIHELMLIQFYLFNIRPFCITEVTKITHGTEETCTHYFRYAVWETITSKPTWKLKHTNSILEYFEYFCQMSSKLILTILSYTVSKLMHFLRQVIAHILYFLYHCKPLLIFSGKFINCSPCICLY